MFSAPLRGTNQSEHTKGTLTDAQSSTMSKMQKMRSQMHLSAASYSALGPPFSAISSDGEFVYAPTLVPCILLLSMMSTSLSSPAAIATHSARQPHASNQAPRTAVAECGASVQSMLLNKCCAVTMLTCTGCSGGTMLSTNFACVSFLALMRSWHSKALRCATSLNGFRRATSRESFAISGRGNTRHYMLHLCLHPLQPFAIRRNGIDPRDETSWHIFTWTGTK
ncbi:hypothetical protein TRVL_06549 [Trypanosoma vivax]|nr:hypothetical protein TRVL_06549 [Trypanosoma vivax]